MKEATTLSHLSSSADAGLSQLADRAANTADKAIQTTQRVANETLDRLQDEINALRGEAPGTFGRLAAEVESLTHRGMDRARQASADVRDRVAQAGDGTVAYIRDEPVKSMLIAAAAGATLAALVALLVHQRDSRA